MIMIKFKSANEHEELLKKVKYMKHYIAELEDCLEEAVEQEDLDFRNKRYLDYDRDEEEMYARRGGGRYGYRGRSNI